MFTNNRITMKSKIQIKEKEYIEKHPLDYSMEEFNSLVKIYQNKLYKAAFYFSGNREDAQDIVQETILIGLTSLRNFKGYSSYYTWLYSILLNLIKKRYRNKKKKYILYEDELSFFSQEESYETLNNQTPLHSLENDEIVETVEKVLNKLPEKYRTVLVLRHLEEMNYAEISEVLKCSLGTVKTRIHKGRKILRKKLEHYYA